MNTTTSTASIAKALSLDILEPSERIDILNDLYDLITKGTLIRLVERMNDEQKTEFDNLLASNASEEEVEAFLQQKVPGADEAVRETIDELQRDILAVTA